MIRASLEHLQAEFPEELGFIEKKDFAGHSLRRGGLNHGRRSGNGRFMAKMHGRWRSDAIDEGKCTTVDVRDAQLLPQKFVHVAGIYASRTDRLVVVSGGGVEASCQPFLPRMCTCRMRFILAACTLEPTK